MSDRHPLHDRHRLARTLHTAARDHGCHNVHTGVAGHLADAVIAAGWRPPAQVIETIGEVDALPVGSILADRDGDAWQLLPGGWRCPALDNEWMDRSDDWFTAADALAEGPLTVLRIPTKNGDTDE